MLSSAFHEIIHGTGENPIRAHFNVQVYPYPRHWHEEIEIIYSVGEGATIAIENVDYRLSQRDILIVWPGDIHSYNYSEKGSSIIFIQFPLSILGQNYRLFSKMPKTPLIQPTHPAHNLIETHFLNIWHEYCDNRPDYLLAVMGEIHNIMLVLLRGIEWVPFSKSKADKLRRRFERLKNVFAYINEHHNGDIKLYDAAAAASFSVYHFTRFFKDATGLTFWQYLSRYRIERAKELLSHGDMTITEIAFASGFSSVKTFNRVFKELTGCAPSQYRQKSAD